MPDKQYTIGEFAAINKMSARMLRHYDKIGLLKPAAVAENGYRFYSSAQVSVAALIKKYRACAFSLEEIAILLEKRDEFSRLAKQKIQELNEQNAAHSDALHRLYELSDASKIPFFDNLYEISFTTKRSQLLCVSSRCGKTQVEREFDDLYDFLEAAGLRPSGLRMLFCDLSMEDGYQVAVPVIGKTDNGTYAFEYTKAGQYLSTFHYGGYEEIAVAYDKLPLHIEQNGLNSDGIFFERYFLDSANAAYPAEYITEISVKITP